ncbi:MAG: hypothetical protein HOY79_14345 [Streptomyces sp.]|nr:hypothetical protein [Streptomyces sp.]
MTTESGNGDGGRREVFFMIEASAYGGAAAWLHAASRNAAVPPARTARTPTAIEA